MPVLSSKTDECVIGGSIRNFNMFDNSIDIPFNGIKSCILWFKAMYSASVGDNVISVYILHKYNIIEI